jgi:hypothetical protein
MKIKWGSIVTDGRNKLGGQVYSKNASGSYVRNKVTPVNPSSASQVTVRSRFSTISQEWRALTTAQIAAWNAAVSDFKKTDIFGDVQNPSGFNLYQKLNNNLDNIGVAHISDPPSPGSTATFDTLSIAAANGAQTLVATVTPGTLPASQSVIISATPGVSNGKSFVKSEFRQIQVVGSVTAGSISLTAAYIAKFGTIPEAGMRIFVQTQFVNATTGQAGQAQQAFTVVIA